MSERATPAQMEIVDYVCDKCGDGTMVRSNGYAVMTSPPQYDHYCTSCLKPQTLRQSYPKTRIVRQEGA